MVKYNKDSSLFDDTSDPAFNGYVFLDVPLNGAVELSDWGMAFRMFYPAVYEHYIKVCEESTAKVGDVLVTSDTGVKFILAFTRVADFGEYQVTEEELINSTMRAVKKFYDMVEPDAHVVSYILGRPHKVWTKLTTFVGDSFTNWNINLSKAGL